MNETGFPNIQIGLYVVRVRAVLVWGVTRTNKPYLHAIIQYSIYNNNTYTLQIVRQKVP
jgi:hypothetical protein